MPTARTGMLRMPLGDHIGSPLRPGGMLGYAYNMACFGNVVMRIVDARRPGGMLGYAYNMACFGNVVMRIVDARRPGGMLGYAYNMACFG